MKAAVYARYSSAHQKESSIADQEAVCRKAAGRLDCAVSEGHIYPDREISGSVSQRPAYQQMMAAAERGEFQAIIAEDTDRLWRDQAEMHTALKLLRHWGVRVFIASTGTDLTSDEGGIIASVTGQQAEAFLTNLKKKIRRGMEGRIRAGYSCGGRPYGYKSVPNYDDTRRDSYGKALVIGYKKVIDEAEAAIVRRIFEMYVDGMSPKQIAYRFNEEGIPAPNGGGWTWQSIGGSRAKASGTLHNPIYVGRLVWGRTQKVRDPRTGKRVVKARHMDDWQETKVPELRIISDELWARGQKRSNAQAENSPGNKLGRHPKYLLSGLLKCGECDSNYTVRKGNGGKWYGCAGHFDKGEAFCSNTKLVRRDRLEQVILSGIFDWHLPGNSTAKMIWEPELLEFFERAIDKMTTPKNDAREAMLARLAAARKKRDNVMAAIERGVVTPTTKGRLVALEAEVAELEAATKKRAEKKPRVSFRKALEAVCSDVKATLETNTDEARRLLSLLVGPIILQKQGKSLMAELRGNRKGWLEIAGVVDNVVPEEGLEPPRA